MIVIIQKMDCLCRHFFVVVVVRRKYIPTYQRKSTSSNAAQVLARVRQCSVL